MIQSGNYTTLRETEQTLADPRPALPGMPRPFIVDPDLVERLRLGLPLAVPDPAIFYGPGRTGLADGYTDYLAAETADR